MEEQSAVTTEGISYRSDRPAVRVKNLGLTVLHEPQDEPAADVIFIHGLQGNPRKTWCYDGSIESAEPLKRAESPRRFQLFKKYGRSRKSKGVDKAAQSVFWPAEILPNDCKNVRILTYGYDSHVSGQGGSPNQNNISQHGRALWNAILVERRHLDCLDRPLVFVAHSLGGLLVKEVLIECRKQRKRRPKEDLSKICEGIIFFGTPHRGSSDASWGLLLCNIAGAVQMDTNSSVLRDLDPSSGSSKLEDLRRDFSDLLDEDTIRVHSFQESAGKTSLKFAGGKVVPDESSSFDSRKFETLDTINANHMNMCRFLGQDDDGYVKFVGALAAFLQIIEEKSQKEKAAKLEAKQAEETQRREDLLRRLEYEERLAREAQVEGTDAKAATMSWLWSLESFEQWLLNKEALFWITGKPGSGKSTLMAHISHDDKSLELLQSTSERSWAIIRFFFDFREGKNIANNMEGLLRSLLLQMLKEIPDLSLPARISERADYNSDKMLNWNLKELRETLNKVCTGGRKNICILIDGLDEYEGRMIDLLLFFHELAAGGSDTLCTVKICLASRPEPQIFQSLKTCPGFRMEDFNLQGIKQYVSTTLYCSVPSSDFERLHSISDDIADKAEGVFLWARFAINELIVGFARGDDLEELHDRLDQLPQDLEKLYDQIFDRMTPEDLNLASVIFRLVCFKDSYTPLSVQAIKLAVDMAMGKKVRHDRILNGQLIEDLRKWMTARSGGLLEIVQCDEVLLYEGGLTDKDEDKYDVRLTHKTVKSYLERRGWLQRHTQAMENTGLAAHTLWLDICCRYLEGFSMALGTELSARNLNDRSFNNLARRFWLLFYAVNCIFRHAQKVEETYKISSFKSIIDFISGGFLYAIQFQVPWALWPHDDESFGRRKWSFQAQTRCHGQVWRLILHQRLLLCYKDAIIAGQHTPDADDIASALHEAPYLWGEEKRLDELISLMVSHGVIVNENHISGCIHYGFAKALEAILKTHAWGSLKRKEFRFNCRHCFGHGHLEQIMSLPIPALAFGCSVVDNFEDMLKLLLETGEDINETGEPYGAMIHIIISIDYNRPFERLQRLSTVLHHGANVNLVGHAGTPLQQAWNNRKYDMFWKSELPQVLKTLIDNGASIGWHAEDGTVPTKEEILAWRPPTTSGLSMEEILGEQEIVEIIEKRNYDRMMRNIN